MNKTVFESILQGLNEAIAYMNGTADVSQYRVHFPKQRDLEKLAEKPDPAQEKSKA